MVLAQAVRIVKAYGVLTSPCSFGLSPAMLAVVAETKKTEYHILNLGAMSHEDLCVRARRWLAGSRRCDPVFSGIASCDEIPDVIGWSSCYRWRGSTVIECKTSVADFHADKRKSLVYRHPQWGEYPAKRMTAAEAEREGYVAIRLPRMGDFRFFLCEPGVLTPWLIEQYAPDHGLIYARGSRRVVIARPAPRRTTDSVDRAAEIRYLRFAIINGKRPYAAEREQR